MKRKFLLLALTGLLTLSLSGCNKTDPEAIEDGYTGYYRASGTTVTIKNKGVSITTASAILDNDKKIVNVNIDSILIPLQGMAGTTGTRPTIPEAIALITDTEADRYNFILDAGDKIVNSKKTLGEAYWEEGVVTTLVERSWASQIKRLETYPIGKDYSSFLAKICHVTTTGSYCTNEVTATANVPEGALTDFYGYTTITGMSLKLFKSEYDNIGQALVEMFNSKFKKAEEITKDTKFYSSMDYSVAMADKTITVSWTNNLIEGTKPSDDTEATTPTVLNTIEDSVTIPLKIRTSTAITITNTRTYVEFDSSNSQVYSVDRTDYDVDHVKSKYEK